MNRTPNYIDLTDKVCNNWKVIGISHKNKDRKLYWKCKCIKCNLEKPIRADTLRINKYVSCLCETVNGVLGKNFGRVTVIGPITRARKKGEPIIVRCKCNTCGTIQELVKKQLTRTNHSSKGCNCIKFGTKYKDSNGYISIYLPGHPSANRSGSVLEHRLVMEKKIGRQLFSNEHVHHKNGFRDDNNPENLELWVKPHPPGQRVIDMFIFCKEFVEKYQNICTCEGLILNK